MQIGDADRVPGLPHPDPHVGHDGDLHVDDDPAGLGVGRPDHARSSTPSRASHPPMRRSPRWPVRRSVVFDEVDFQLPRCREPCCTASRFIARAGRDDRHHRLHRLRQDDAGQPGAAAVRRHGGRVLVGGVDVRDARPGRPRGRASGWSRRSPTSSPARSPPTCATATRTRPTTSSGRPCGSPRRATSSGACRAAWTRRSPRAGPTCRAASASAWRSPGRSCASPRSTCSTTRSRRSTSPPTPGCGQP